MSLVWIYTEFKAEIKTNKDQHNYTWIYWVNIFDKYRNISPTIEATTDLCKLQNGCMECLQQFTISQIINTVYSSPQVVTPHVCGMQKGTVARIQPIKHVHNVS